MPVDIIDGFNLGSNIPLDIRYQANTYWDVSAYWYPGMQIFQYSDKQIWWYDGITWSKIIQSGQVSSFDILNGGSNWGESENDKFDGNTVIEDALNGGTY